MRYRGSRNDVIVLDNDLYTVSTKYISKDGSNGKVKADPSYYRCTNYYYTISDYSPYVALHKYNKGSIVPNQDLIFREPLTKYQPSSWTRKYPNYEAFTLADDASEDLLSQLFDFWQGLKDAVDALKTVGTTVSRIDSALPYLASGNFSKAARVVTGKHILANSWLEYNFAIRPTIHTCQLAIQHAIKDRSQAFRMHKKRSDELTTTVSRTMSFYNLRVNLRMKAEGAASRYFTAAALQQNFDRMAFTRPAPAIWDAIPWSFAIDWFLPVGTWLDQMSRITQYASDGCDVSVVRLTGDYLFTERAGTNYRIYSERGHAENFTLVRRTNSSLGAKTWDLQGLLSRSEFGLNARRVSYLCSIVASKYRKTFLGGLL